MVDSLLEEEGDALGDSLMMDDKRSNILHSTFAHFLVDMDVSKGLPVEILIKSFKGKKGI